MISLHKLLTYSVLGGMTLCGTPGLAAMSGEIAAIEAIGNVDLDGFGGAPPISNDIDTEHAPFSRSVVSVADSLTGVFSYSASADIGLKALKVAGSVTNGTGSRMGEGESAILRASAQALDILTLTSETPGVDLPITMELVVTGTLSPGNVHANSELYFGLLSQPNGSDFGSYGPGDVNDTLTVTRNVTFTTENPSVDMDFDARLSLAILTAEAGQTVFGNLGNTAFLQLSLPPGVSMTASASGTFGVPIPIPEPHNYVLMLAGLALIASALRRHSFKAA